MRDGSVHPVRLDAYRPPEFRVTQADLTVQLDPRRTRVAARLELRRNPAAPRNADLVLDGEDLVLRSIKINGYPLRPSEYTLRDARLVIPGQPDTVLLETEVEINPGANTALEGLYLSNGRYCTQCEAQGFRRITFFPDRPDVLACFTTTLIADPAACPVLLGNGNPAGAGTLPDGRHWARFEDPFPKPCYLFALVAGQFATLEDRFITASGREVRLAIHTEPAFASQTGHAMAALKAAMAWDERVYGREYDLSVYHIVAVGDFNMGAMENKGLNIFNTRYVLADADTATDQDYQHIEAVIAHEYFHNWTGNRVTCRDWFQLSLKEGLTVFRDQQFSADVGSAAVKRIGDVRLLRTAQFAEDASPLAHPVRPDSYIEINNFYTATVYNKGAEVVRMLHTLLGPQRFRAGMDRYFARHDGQAVTVEDFLAAHQAASGVDLAHFQRWYAQAGTPTLRARTSYDPAARRCTLTLSQHTAPTPGQPDKQPLHIPVAMGLLDAQGRKLPLWLHGEAQPGPDTRVLALTEATQDFVFEGLSAPPIPSLLRGFSAPVRLDTDLDETALAVLAAHDTDSWCRYDAVQQLYLRTLLRALRDDAGAPCAVPEVLVRAVHALLADAASDPALIAEMLVLPSELYLAGEVKPVHPERIHHARLGLKTALAQRLREAFSARYEALAPRGAYGSEAPEVARRSLRGVCLNYLGELDEGAARAHHAYAQADNMTDAMAALGTLVHLPGAARDAALADFAARHRNRPLAMDKWFALQAGARSADAPQRVRELFARPDYQRLNPNRVRALLGTYTQANPLHFHAPDGSGYALLEGELLVLDAQNPQLAARMASPLVRWRRFEPDRAALMRATLERLAGAPGLSSDVYEVVTKALA